MIQAFLHMITPILGLGANVIFQVGAFRLHSRLSLLKSVFLGFGIGLLVVFILDASLFYASPAAQWHAMLDIFLANILTYGALGYGYFHFINLGETARRVRILREIDYFPKGLSLQELLCRYNSKAILQYRIDRLLHNRQIILDRGKYRIGNPSMFFITRIVLSLKQLIIGKKSEFD
jgi:hypothetical protein